MNEIYWITRLDAINLTFGILEVIGVLLEVILLWIYGVIFYNSESEQSKKKNRNLLHNAKVVGIITSLLLVCNIFVPTTKEAYLIYGVGGIIDYVKSNKEANKIPNKAIKALNIFLDNECKSKTDSINK